MESHLAIAGEQPAGAILDAARTAESLGIDGLWLTDVRFTRDCFVLLGACAVATTQLRLAVGVNDPYSRHPAALAAAYATLSELAPGRGIIGLGAGGSGLDKIGVQRSKPLAGVRAGISAIRGLLAGETVSLESPAFALHDGRLAFDSVGAMPIALVAHGPRMYELAGELADIAVIANYATPDAIESARSNIQRGITARAKALEPLRQCWRVDICVSEDREAARSVMRRRVTQLLKSGYYGAAFLEPLGLGHLAGAELTPQAVESVLDGVAFAGEAGEVRNRLREVCSDPNFEMICWRAYPTESQTLHEAVVACHDVVHGALLASERS